MFCKNCGKQLPENATVCPYCGVPQVSEQKEKQQNVYSATQVETPPAQYAQQSNAQNKPKKKFYKKWWFWLIVVLVLFVLISVFSGGDDTAQKTTEASVQTTISENNSVVDVNSNNNASENTTIAEEQTISAEDIDVGGIYRELGKDDDMSYEVSDKTYNFMNKNAKFFPCAKENKSELIELARSDFSYVQISKNPSKYNDFFIALNSVFVIEIQEYTEDEFALSYLHCSDEEGNNYIGYCLGELPDVYDECIVNVYGVILGQTYFSNIGGGTTAAIALAVSDCNVIG